MNYLSDTNAVIALLKAKSSLSRRVRGYPATSFALPANLATVEGLRFEIVNVGRADARRAGEIRAILATAATPIGPLIPAQALARGLTLPTRTTSEFARVPGLVVEDWETAALSS